MSPRISGTHEWEMCGQIAKYTQACFAENVRQRFGFTKGLRCAPFFKVTDEKEPLLFVTGGQYTTQESGASVDLEIRVDKDCRILPVVFADATWLSPYSKDQDQRFINWHRYTDGAICYCHPDDWREFSEKHMQESTQFLCEILVTKLYKDVTQWLNYHRCAFEHGLKEWSSDWPAHPHGRRLVRRQ